MSTPDLTMCCGTTCNKAANARYVKHLEFSLAVLGLRVTGYRNPTYKLPDGIDLDYADKITEQLIEGFKGAQHASK